MRTVIVVLLVLFAGFVRYSVASPVARPDDRQYGRPLTVLAIGDGGETGSTLRNNAGIMTDMFTGRHDGGKFQVLLFLGDNFYSTGLNLPATDVEGKVKSILGPFKEVFDGLGRTAVHSIPGNHDYYRRNAFEASLIFGLFNIAEGPVGISNRGNEREAAIEWWSYHCKFPAQITLPSGGSSPDSVQLIFYDSALPLRTDPKNWAPALDSLSRLLAASRDRRGIGWRIFVTHHPFRSVGEHAGYSIWNDERNTVEYLTNCDKDSNAVSWVTNWLDPQDLCAGRYRQYIDSLSRVIRAGGVRFQAALSGHEHSLQLLYAPDSAGHDPFPAVQIISGAGSKLARVKFPAPPCEFTAAQSAPDREGISLPGFVQLSFRENRMRITFFSATNGDPIDMGGGQKEFWVDRDGRLVDPGNIQER
jgi:hypothetical protein